MFSIDELNVPKKYCFSVMVISDNRSKICEIVKNTIAFIYGTYIFNPYQDGLSDILRELYENKVVEIQCGKFSLRFDIKDNAYGNKGQRRNIVFIGKDLLPLDKERRKDLFVDELDAISEHCSLNRMAKNVPATFII